MSSIDIENELTGLYYLNVMHYNLSSATFITQDSYRGEQNDYGTWNLYAYCGGNPINYVDPSGARERNVGHVNGEEHSRVSKGSNGRAKRTVKNVAKLGAVIGAGYVIYRGVRILPSLLPPLWWTIPGNVAIP